MTLHSNKDVYICITFFSLNAAKWKNFFSVHVKVIFVNWRFNCSQLRSPYLENIYKRKERRQGKGEKKFYALWKEFIFNIKIAERQHKKLRVFHFEHKKIILSKSILEIWRVEWFWELLTSFCKLLNFEITKIIFMMNFTIIS